MEAEKASENEEETMSDTAEVKTEEEEESENGLSPSASPVVENSSDAMESSKASIQEEAQ
jgi:hypothetical protein